MISCHAISLAPLELSTSSGIKHSQSLLAEWAYNAAGVAWVTRVVVTNPMIIVNELSYYRLKMKIFHPLIYTESKIPIYVIVPSYLYPSAHLEPKIR